MLDDEQPAVTVVETDCARSLCNNCLLIIMVEEGNVPVLINGR
jgi:hypothetical protein